MVMRAVVAEEVAVEPFDVYGPVVGQERVRARVDVDAVALDPAVDSIVPVVLDPERRVREVHGRTNVLRHEIQHVALRDRGAFYW